MHFVLLINGIACLFMGVLLALDALFLPATWRVFLTAAGLACFVGTSLTLMAARGRGTIEVTKRWDARTYGTAKQTRAWH